MHEIEAAKIAAQAAAPTAVDLSMAVNAVMNALEGGEPVSESEAVTAVCTALGITARPGGKLDISGDNADHVRTAPLVQYNRARHAARLAIAKLAAQGLIVPLAACVGPPEGVELVEFQSGNSFYGISGHLPVPVGRVLIPSIFQLTPGVSVAGNVALLTVEKWTAELAPLLNERLVRLLGEALSAARRGSHLSGATLLGAVTEGAWYAVGEALRTRDADLAKALDTDRTATVQTKVAEILGTIAKGKAAAAGLLAFATQLRQVRNYGIHTSASDDVAAEEFFTEAGNYVLILQTYSHLVQLLSSTRKVDSSLLP